MSKPTTYIYTTPQPLQYLIFKGPNFKKIQFIKNQKIQEKTSGER